ncbi:hypothetical protein [Brenneria tiliae]|uniref:Transposase n=1 Tax=Brenneria tiliae TaxID=2914984 RepID=A0ABT0MS54_9GAMM|nr:hypothetical protein [Brenneria tiliae]MCL2892024.1 hypothetical protein [Brenneria tiliae]
MRKVEGAAFCPETREIRRRRLASTESQIAKLERRRALLIKALAPDKPE